MASDRRDERVPPDWAAIEPIYRAGVRSLRSIADEYGVTPAAILKHMRKRGVPRDLTARIQAAAQQRLIEHQVNAAEVNVEPAVYRPHGGYDERAVVDANAAALAHVMVGHRTDIARARRIATAMLGELESITSQPELLQRVRAELADGSDDVARAALRELAGLMSSLPQRTKTLKDLSDALGRLIGMEREAYGLDTASGTDGRPVVVIKDYTGRAQQQPQEHAPALPAVALADVPE